MSLTELYVELGAAQQALEEAEREQLMASARVRELRARIIEKESAPQRFVRRQHHHTAD